MSDTFAKWMRAASPEHQQLVALYAGTSRGTMYQVANGHRKWSAAKAHMLEEAMRHLRASDRTAPAPLTVAEMCDACAACPHYCQRRAK